MVTNPKSVLITGSSRGIGKAIALNLARSGYSIVLHGRSESEAIKAVYNQIREEKFPARMLTFDVCDRELARVSLEQDVSTHGIYYGVVLNAGVHKDNIFPFMSGDDWDDVLSTNLDSFYNVLRPLVEPMIVARKGGRIIVMTSVSGILGNRGQVNYSAAKAGLIGASKALGMELARKKITVNCVAPGLIESDMTSESTMEKIVPHIPMRRAGSAEEVCGLVAFLMSDQSSYITRQTISVDGGLT